MGGTGSFLRAKRARSNQLLARYDVSAQIFLRRGCKGASTASRHRAPFPSWRSAGVTRIESVDPGGLLNVVTLRASIDGRTGLGVALPERWLCATIRAALLSLTAVLKISPALTIEALSEPT
jgi:hypothetical protein